MLQVWHDMLRYTFICIWSYVIKGKKINEPRHDKTNKVSVRPAKTQISLGIRPVWSESSLCAQWVAKDPSFLHADSEDSDQTGRMPRLIWVFAGRTCHFVGFVMRRLKCMFECSPAYDKDIKTGQNKLSPTRIFPIDLNFQWRSSKISSQHVLGFIFVDWLSTNLSKSPVSFPIISIVKLAKIRVLLENSTHVERYWKLSTETYYTQGAAVKLLLSFIFFLFRLV